MGTSTGQPWMAGPTARAGRSSRSPQVARSRRCTAFAPKAGARTASSPRDSYRGPMGTSTGQRAEAGSTARAPYSQSRRVALTTLYSFCSQGGGNCTDGELPAGLVQATNGDFYGTTSSGGANVAPNGASAGTIFKITPSGTLTTLYSFCSQSGCTDGYVPDAGLVQATNGDFYGTTWGGGVNGEGTVLRITPSGMLTTLYNFCSQPVSGECTDGANPVAALVQDTNGDLYGATVYGGANTNLNCPSGCGTVFSLSIGLGPFVKTQPTSGTVGKFVEILGTNLTGATIVTFNGTPATFKVVSRYLITTSVPSGATNGKVQVITPSRTLSSNVPFRVP